ncbi:proton channel OTOP1-like [Anguilla anguilla]|uniref:proton channel OTOP1-like n=1 Tax=Anguilla anguilla TaxID=7936 RepID=UPI0015ABF6B5|nr:proton channel OTOP1-like [Anguilla anguilla]
MKVMDLDNTDLSAMVDHGGLDIMRLNKHRHSSSSSSTPEKGKTSFNRLKVGLTEDYPKKNAEILSAQYGTNLLLFGAALILAVSSGSQVVREEHLLSFITTIMIVQLLWMLWYSVRRDRRKRRLSEKDAHGATRWLRGGITVLALLSLIMDAFLIGRYVGYKACASAAQAVYPVVHTVHTISQVYFLWFHIKDVVKTFETIERFGVIHAVFTNLLLWATGIMSESEHFMNAYRERHGTLNHTGVEHILECNCNTSACSMFANSLYYLHPFNIEFHILVSAMLFVMWKNIGRTIEPRHNKKRSVTNNAGLVLGPILGLVALTGTITVLVVYTVKLREAAVSQGGSENTMFYCHGIVMLACMCTAGTLGLVLYRMDNRPLDASKIPSRKLDTELLFGASMGSWLMSWCSMVAVVARGAPGYSWTGFLYSLLLILEKYIQNLFIIESLYRKHEVEPLSAPEVFAVPTPTHDLPCNGIVNRAYENQDGACENGRVQGCPPEHPAFPLSVPVTLSRKRQILKNIAIFLFLCNISLWLLPAFGCRPQYDNGSEQETFGSAIWTMVLNFAMPLNLFYRMHSVASLFEVFQKV